MRCLDAHIVKSNSIIPYQHFATSGNLSLASGERSPSNQQAKATARALINQASKGCSKGGNKQKVHMLLPGILTTLYTAALEALESLPKFTLTLRLYLLITSLSSGTLVLTISPCTVVRGCLAHFKQAMLSC